VLFRSIPTNATIDTVLVEYSNSGSNYTLKLTRLATIGETNAANWAAIGTGTSLHTGLSYNGLSFISTPIKTAIQDALADRVIYIGALCED